MTNLIVVIDLIIRGISILGLIPYGFMLIFTVTMANDSGTSEAFIFSMGLLFIGVALGLIVMFSAMVPNSEIHRLNLVPKKIRNPFVVRIPAYLYLLPGVWLIWHAWLKHQLWPLQLHRHPVSFKSTATK